MPTENPSGANGDGRPPGGSSPPPAKADAGSSRDGPGRASLRSAFVAQARRWTWFLLNAAAAVAAAGCVSGAFGDRWWVFEALGAFRVQCAWILGATAAAFALGRCWLRCAVAGTFVLAAVLSFGDVWLGDPSAAAGPRYRALLLNVSSWNPGTAAVLEYIREADPDLMVLLEVTPKWMEALEPVRATHSEVVADPREDSFGIALFSRLPLADGRIVADDAGVPVVRAVVRDVELVVLGLHAVPPIGADRLALRNAQIDRLAALVRGTPEPAIVLCDLNAVPWSPAFERLLRRTGLRDSRVGFGLQPTW